MPLFRDPTTGIYELLKPCCQCGACCLVRPCPIAISELGLPADYIHGPAQPCPMLRFSDAGFAECQMVMDDPSRAEEFGFGAGCCVKSRVVDNEGNTWNFADLDDDIKRGLAERMRQGTIPHMNTPQQRNRSN